MFCRNCGKELPENAYVCIGCGCLAERKSTQPTKKIEIENVTENKSKDGLLFRIFLMVSFTSACLAIGTLTITGVCGLLGIILPYMFAFVSVGFGIFVLILGLRQKEPLKLISILNFIFSVSMVITTFIPFAYFKL